MNILRLLPVVVSFLLIAAHFQRAGLTPLVIASLLAPGLLIVTRPWSVRIIQTLLALATVEWLRTLVLLVELRQAQGLSWMRLAVILLVVALATGASTLIFRLPALRGRYDP